MNRLLPAVVLLGSAVSAHAEEIESAYTDLDLARDCALVSDVEEGVDAADYVCPGYLGFPVLVFYDDLRESIAYGFPSEGTPAWESFDAFNAAGPKAPR